MKRLTWLIAVLPATPALAHDFWIQPAKFNVAPGAPVALTLFVGHGVDRGRWGVAPSRILRFVAIGPGGSTDRRAALHTDSGSDDATLRFANAGTHVVVLESNHASSILPALRFDDYVRVEGIAPIAARRGGTTADGREIYSRRAKALVQVGAITAGQAQVTRPAGLTLEIVPQINPYALPVGKPLPLRVYYEGKPLPGATVKFVNLDRDAQPLSVRLTDARGNVAFEVPRRGRWQFNVVWSKTIARPDADYDTTFSSLTFGYDN